MFINKTLKSEVSFLRILCAPDCSWDKITESYPKANCAQDVMFFFGIHPSIFCEKELLKPL